MINDLGPSRFNKSFGSLPVADIDVPAVLYGKCFRKPIAFGGEDFAVDHEIDTGLAVERKLAHLWNLLKHEQPLCDRLRFCLHVYYRFFPLKSRGESGMSPILRV